MLDGRYIYDYNANEGVSQLCCSRKENEEAIDGTGIEV